MPNTRYHITLSTWYLLTCTYIYWLFGIQPYCIYYSTYYHILFTSNLLLSFDWWTYYLFIYFWYIIGGIILFRLNLIFHSFTVYWHISAILFYHVFFPSFSFFCYSKFTPIPSYFRHQLIIWFIIHDGFPISSDGFITLPYYFHLVFEWWWISVLNLSSPLHLVHYSLLSWFSY